MKGVATVVVLAIGSMLLDIMKESKSGAKVLLCRNVIPVK